MTLIGGFLYIFDCSIFRWALQPCMGSHAYPKLQIVYLFIDMVGLCMMGIGRLIPSKPVRDDYNSAV